MFISVRPKELKKDYRVSATFEHEGVQYEERFNELHHFLRKCRKTKDAFVHAVDYKDMKVLHHLDVQALLHHEAH